MEEFSVEPLHEKYSTLDHTYTSIDNVNVNRVSSLITQHIHHPSLQKHTVKTTQFMGKGVKRVQHSKEKKKSSETHFLKSWEPNKNSNTVLYMLK